MTPKRRDWVKLTNKYGSVKTPSNSRGGYIMGIFAKILNKITTFKCECGGVVEQVNYNRDNNFQCNKCLKKYTVR
jgi:hypothetical protein